MLSKEYLYKSNQHKQQYIMDYISYWDYEKYIEKIKIEELERYDDPNEKLKISDEIFDFEIKQQEEATKLRIEKNSEKYKTDWEREKKEREEQQLRKEEERMQSITPDERLYQERENFYKNDVPNIIEEYKVESKKYRTAHNRNQWIIIIGSTIVTSTTGATFFNNAPSIKGIAAICSIMVSISAGIMGYFKYRERSTNLQETADDIEHEYEAVRLGTHHYLGIPREKAMGIFADKVRTRINQQKKQQQILEQPSETKQAASHQLNS